MINLKNSDFCKLLRAISQSNSQNPKISFGYVDFQPKTFLILYPSLENSTTSNAIISIIVRIKFEPHMKAKLFFIGMKQFLNFFKPKKRNFSKTPISNCPFWKNSLNFKACKSKNIDAEGRDVLSGCPKKVIWVLKTLEMHFQYKNYSLKIVPLVAILEVQLNLVHSRRICLLGKMAPGEVGV